MRLNSAKINQQWRHILRKVKCKELTDNMKILWTTFEAAVISKNKIIQTLLGDLEDSELQYSMMLENHVQIVNRLIGLHQDRLEACHKRYTSEKEALLSAANLERINTSTQSDYACEFLQTVIYDMNSRNKSQHKACTSSATAKQDELRNQMQSEIEKVEEQGSLQIEEVWHSIQQVLKDYVTDTAPNRPHYNALRAKDKANTEQLLRHCDTVNKYSDLIVDLKQQLALMHCTHTVKLKELREEQSEFLAQFDRMRHSINHNQARDESKLTTLAVVSSEVIKELTKLAQRGESILQMASTCQKFLSEKEKLKNYSAVMRNEDKTEDDETPLKEMDNFWQQYNEVVLECRELSAEKDALSTENKQLRKILRHYLNTLVRPTTVPRAMA
ncbi:dynein regulatory complex subunit 2-like isoform X2 [Homalodisca vitripennis]|nr:dynein regulatory complex subunit 2-like isoform X2 [Homalodisca vitripennis]KAG8297221.1 Dynein regulatory complex subunit 2 [Homalodisca vitripennis]